MTKSETLDKTLSTVLHEVRNPLGVIGLHAGIIARNPDRAMDSARIIGEASQQLEKILTELINFSKPVTLNTELISFSDRINRIISTIKPAFDKKNVVLLLENRLKTDIFIEYDVTKLNQVFFNLLKNALEASEPGKTVKIILEVKKDRLFAKISDQGVGIPAENREKIFKPYFTTKKNGTGIGLALARKITEAHGGGLYVESRGKKGSTFVWTYSVKDM